MTQDPFDVVVDQVVAAGNCSGCGACTLIDRGLTMQLQPSGFLRPVRTRSGTTADVDTRSAAFEQTCPGRRVEAPDARALFHHAILGTYISAWQAWATDDETRFRGSSGGTLTALVAWLVESGAIPSAVAVGRCPTDAGRTVPVTITDRAGALAAAGSRYAPVSTAGVPLEPGAALVGKPCEASARRQYARSIGQPPPLLLSFFCAGVPSQLATSRLLRDLGLPDDQPLRELRYRGHGWPGDFYAEALDESSGRRSYEDSWGEALGPAVQWRCKICPDGMGESADITAGDYWRTDASGHPDFSEADGQSVLVARTERGHAIVLRAIAAGVIDARPLDPEDVCRVQPYQVERRRALAGRLTGARAAGRPVPTYEGFGLWHQARQRPLLAIRAAAGAWLRSLRWRRAAEHTLGPPRSEAPSPSLP